MPALDNTAVTIVVRTYRTLIFTYFQPSFQVQGFIIVVMLEIA